MLSSFFDSKKTVTVDEIKELSSSLFLTAIGGENVTYSFSKSEIDEQNLNFALSAISMKVRAEEMFSRKSIPQNPPSQALPPLKSLKESSSLEEEDDKRECETIIVEFTNFVDTLSFFNKIDGIVSEIWKFPITRYVDLPFITFSGFKRLLFTRNRVDESNLNIMIIASPETSGIPWEILPGDLIFSFFVQNNYLYRYFDAKENLKLECVPPISTPTEDKKEVVSLKDSIQTIVHYRRGEIYIPMCRCDECKNNKIFGKVSPSNIKRNFQFF